MEDIKFDKLHDKLQKVSGCADWYPYKSKTVSYSIGPQYWATRLAHHDMADVYP